MVAHNIAARRLRGRSAALAPPPIGNSHAQQGKSRKAEIHSLPKIRFDALAGYARSPNFVLIIEELEWYATTDERLLGMAGAATELAAARVPAREFKVSRLMADRSAIRRDLARPPFRPCNANARCSSLGRGHR